MTRGEFEAAARAADVLQNTSDIVAAEFWIGYLRGLRRHFHGEHFGRARGIGYRCGVAGTPIAEAMAEARRLRDPVRRAP